jgi:hypothetical protein
MLAEKERQSEAENHHSEPAATILQHLKENNDSANG